MSGGNLGEGSRIPQLNLREFIIKSHRKHEYWVRLWMEAEFRVEFRIQNWSCKENLPRRWETINEGNRRLRCGFSSRTWSRSKVGEVRKRETEGRAEYTEKERNEGELGFVSGNRGGLARLNLLVYFLKNIIKYNLKKCRIKNSLLIFFILTFLKLI